METVYVTIIFTKEHLEVVYLVPSIGQDFLNFNIAQNILLSVNSTLSFRNMLYTIRMIKIESKYHCQFPSILIGML